MTAPLAVGLVGAGPWARMVHAPVLAAGPETTLAGIWNRTAGKATDLAGQHGVPAFERYEDLLQASDAIAFCVSPEAQPDLAIEAARAGKPLLLEKPLGADLASAERLVAAIDEAGVPSMVVLSFRYSDAVREFIDQAQTFDALGARACFFSGALLEGPFAYGWRLERGGLLDVGPHIIDLVDAALGPVVGVTAHGDERWVGLLLDHDGGARSEVTISCHASGVNRCEVELYGVGGSMTLDARSVSGPRSFGVLRREFADVARGGRHDIDAHRALHLQRVIADAEAQLAH